MKKITKIVTTLRTKLTTAVDTKPFVSFVGLLAILFVLVIIGNFLRRPLEEKNQQAKPAKQVETYSNGQSPTMKLTGKVEKSGVITVIAQTGGVVQSIPVTEGKSVGRGSTLVRLSATYGGSNPASLTREIAQKNNAFTTETFDLQKDIIAKQRDLATNGNTQASELREITRKSLEDTKNLITLNEDIVSSLDQQITVLTAGNVNGANDSAILGAKQGKSAALAGLNSLRSTLRTLEYQSDNDKIPAHSADLSKDLTLRQLELQEKSLVLGKELSDLNLKLARVSESLFYPVSPCAGVVERVFVKVGQSVNPGTPIAQIKATVQEVQVVVPVAPDLIHKISRADPSIVSFAGKNYEVFPRYVSTENTEGGLPAVFFTLPASAANAQASGSNVTVIVPIGMAKIAATEIFIPLESVYQTQESSFVYVAVGSGDAMKATAKQVVLGEVAGKYVKVLSGIDSQDKVIVTRGIADGDVITTK